MIKLVELKQAWRSLRRAPRLGIAVVLCVAVGMAATAAVATLVNLTTFAPLPFPEADRLVRIWNEEVGVTKRDEVSFRDYEDLKANLSTLEELELTSRARLIFHLPGRPGRRVEGEAITPGYFGLLGVNPHLGRLMTPDEYESGEFVMLLAYQTWAREFNFDENIVGQKIRTSYQTSQGVTADIYTVIGVLPETFYGTIEADIPDIEFWIPVNAYLSAETRSQRSARTAFVLGRMADGETITSVSAEAEILAAALGEDIAEYADSHAFNVEPMGTNWRSPFREGGMLLSFAAVLLLAVAMLNVSMVLIARTLDRATEFAVRSALGANRARLTGQIILEVTILSLVGGVIGMFIATPLLEFFLELSGVTIPLYLELKPSVLTLGGAFSLLLIAGAAAGLFPAQISAGVRGADVLHGGGSRLAGSRMASRTGSALVIGEIAVTVVLVVAASLLIRSYIEIEHSDLGYATENRLRTALFINQEDVEDPAQLPAFVDRVEQELRGIPGVQDVALVWPTVPTMFTAMGRLMYPGMPAEEMENGLRVGNYIAGDRFFAAMEIPVLAGRTFDERDGSLDMRTAIVSAPLADKFGGAEKALEQIVQLNETDYRIIGVVGDAKFAGPLEDDFHRYEMYLSYRQLPRRIVSAITKVEGDPLAYTDKIPRKLGEMAPNSAVDWIDGVDQFISWLYRDKALRVALLLAFSLSALLLSAIGLYAVLAQSVVRATREIGVRKSLGAQSSDILQQFMLRGLSLVSAGLGIGLVAALGVVQFMSSLLYGVQPFDFLSFLVAAVVLLLIALLASFSPAYRAARVEPMEALRYE